jgi:tetratricopeptide (TPR) repeat protein
MLARLRKALLAAAALSAAGNALGQDYDACVALAERAPHAGLAHAERWAQEGGGAPATHCAAVALTALGATRRAAERLTALATAPDAGPAPTRAAILAQAGALWLALGDVGAALAALDRAVALDPQAIGPRRTRAAAAMADGRPVEAARDLTAALAATPGDAGLLTARSAAWLAAQNAAAALTDANAAVAAMRKTDAGEADTAAALLGRGRALAALGRADAARAALLDAVAADRDGPTAAVARDALQDLDPPG